MDVQKKRVEELVREEITRIQAAMKLSQNRDEKNYDRVVKALKARGDVNSTEIAKLMKKRK